MIILHLFCLAHARQPIAFSSLELPCGSESAACLRRLQQQIRVIEGSRFRSLLTGRRFLPERGAIPEKKR